MSRRVRPRPSGKPTPPPQSASRWRPDVAIGLLLLAVTVIVYSQVRSYDFVNYDDPLYVGKNLHVRAGLTISGLRWALTSFEAANWFPLTWLTHMADYQFFGMNAGWHHLTNVWLHAFSSLLLFAALKRMTGARWRSAFVAFLFALHPLHVESVAWIAERKDVLCGLFWFLTLWCYARYVEKPGALRYLAVLLSFCLGLMSKPMIVTLPFVLLLLDFWPLKRPKFRLLEKLPLFCVAAGASLITFMAQRAGGAVAPLAGTSLALRVANAVVSYVLYIRDMFWPLGLAVLYPLPNTLPFFEVAACGLVLSVISYLAARQFRARPWLTVGWCWYLVTLTPVIGLIQVGSQARADRYAYVPTIGLFVVLAWGAAELAERKPGVRKMTIAAAVAACAACVAVTWSQIQYWANSESLALHALQVTRGNFIMHNNLADYYLEQNRNEEARVQAAAALDINPGFEEACLDLGAALSRLKRPAEAEKAYRQALKLPLEGKQIFEAHSGLGEALAEQHRLSEALPELQIAAQLEPRNADALFNLSTALATLGRNNEAAAGFSAAIRLKPADADTHRGLGLVFANEKEWSEAAAEFADEVRLQPGDALAHFNLANALVRAGHLDEAIADFAEAVRLNPGFEAAREDLQIAEAQRKAFAKR